MPSPEHDPLDPLLARLQAHTPELPPGQIAPEVWHRLESSKKVEVKTGDWLGGLYAMFARPSFAAAFVAACMLLGLFLAEVHHSRAQAAYNRQLMQNYLRLIDPLLTASDLVPPPPSAPSKS